MSDDTMNGPYLRRDDRALSVPLADKPLVADWDPGPLLLADLEPTSFCICSGGRVAITVAYGPPLDVEIAPGLDTTGAAKVFLNEVARICGKPPPFPWK
jgi:hypothetical protein